ncbi:hypothetical protein AA313_de0201940 [Arthrobotrys entomopaga]|nr:hypothetical protein AA313_de0201940 [Arthrobotrys entomopaga]
MPRNSATLLGETPLDKIPPDLLYLTKQNAKRKPFIPPANAPPRDTRPLPPGWYQQYDSYKNIWYYVDTNLHPFTPFWDHPCDMGYDQAIYGRRFTVEQVIAARRAGYKLSGAHLWWHGATGAEGETRRRTMNPYANNGNNTAGGTMKDNHGDCSTSGSRRNAGDGGGSNTHRPARRHAHLEDNGEESESHTTRTTKTRTNVPNASSSTQRRGKGTTRTTDEKRERARCYTPRVLKFDEPPAAPAPPPPYASPVGSIRRRYSRDVPRIRRRAGDSDVVPPEDFRHEDLYEESQFPFPEGAPLDDGSRILPDFETQSEFEDDGEETAERTREEETEAVPQQYTSYESPRQQTLPPPPPPITMMDKLRRFFHFRVPTPAERELKRRLKIAQREQRSAESSQRKQKKYQEGIEQTKNYMNMISEMNRREREIMEGNVTGKMGFDPTLFQKKVAEGTLMDDDTGNAGETSTANQNRAVAPELPSYMTSGQTPQILREGKYKSRPAEHRPTQSRNQAGFYDDLSPESSEPETSNRRGSFFTHFRRNPSAPRRRRKKIYLKTPPYLGSYEDLPYAYSGGILADGFQARGGLSREIPRPGFLWECERQLGNEFMLKEKERRRRMGHVTNIGLPYHMPDSPHDLLRKRHKEERLRREYEDYLEGQAKRYYGMEEEDDGLGPRHTDYGRTFTGEW